MPWIRWSPTAKRDLDGIFDYIGNEGARRGTPLFRKLDRKRQLTEE